MQQEIRFATFNVCNLAPAGTKLYDNLEPLSPAQYEAKAEWTARQIDLLDADVIGFQEIFSQAALRDVLSRTRRYREAVQAGYDAADAAGRMLPTVALVSRLPLAGPGVAHADFPAGISLPADASDDNPCRFARAPLHVQVMLPGGQLTDVVVLHLKSRRPDYRHGEGSDALAYALANLRSLQRRGAEAVALRVLVSELGRSGRPRIVLGADGLIRDPGNGEGARDGARSHHDDVVFDLPRFTDFGRDGGGLLGVMNARDTSGDHLGLRKVTAQRHHRVTRFD